MTGPEARDRMLWIVGGEHAEALTSAAEWVHANAHWDVPSDRRPDPVKPCDECWRISAFAVKGAILVGYRKHDESRAVGMREAAAMLRRYCPTHGAEDTCLMDCHCAGADEIDRDARKIDPTAPTT